MADIKTTPSKAEDQGKSGPREFLRGTNLPQSRVRTIMKSSPDSDQISTQALLIVTKAAELFIQHMAREAIKKSRKPTLLEYRDLAEVVDGNEKLDFLSTIMPLKITVREYKKNLEDGSDSEFDSMASTSGEDSSSEEEEESDDVEEVKSSRSVSEEPGSDNESNAGSVIELSSGDEGGQKKKKSK